jgi:hypothetical protein
MTHFLVVLIHTRYFIYGPLVNLEFFSEALTPVGTSKYLCPACSKIFHIRDVCDGVFTERK